MMDRYVNNPLNLDKILTRQLPPFRLGLFKDRHVSSSMMDMSIHVFQ